MYEIAITPESFIIAPNIFFVFFPEVFYNYIWKVLQFTDSSSDSFMQSAASADVEAWKISHNIAGFLYIARSFTIVSEPNSVSETESASVFK
jgi:hypothetical protein